uniref:Tight junction protein 1a n=1 Tax=Petromyzon marinus TaxID=7757 RepID=S4RW48_PETMA
QAGTMEETIWEQHTVTLHKAPGFGFGIAISGGKDNPHFQSGETSIVISDVLKGGPAEGMLHENDRVVTVNGKHMENVEHAFAVQQLRNSGKTAKITIKRKQRAQPPSSRQPLHEPEAADEIFEAAKEEEEEGEEEEEDDFDRRSARSSRWRSEEDRNAMRSERSRGRSMSPGSSDRRSVGSYYQPKLVKVTLVKSKKSEEYGLRLGSQIFVKDVSAEGLAARDGNIHDGDIVLKINGTVTENMSLADARKLIERSKGKLRMVLQRDDQGTLITIPDLEDSIPSSNLSDRDDISEIQSLVSEPSDEAQSRQSSRSRSREDIRSPESETPSRSTGQPSTRTVLSKDKEHVSKCIVLSTPFNNQLDHESEAWTRINLSRNGHTTPSCPVQPRPTFSRGGQPDVDLPVSPTPALPNSTLQYQGVLGMEMKLVKFRKGESVGLRLAGGNDVGIFVAGVQEGSPASTQGLEEGDQLLKVNNVDFQNIIREEAVLFLLELPKGEEVSILAQRKKDVYRRVVESDVGDSFYIRTHFGYEKETPYGLSFTRGEVFRVVDTLYNGKLGSWLAIRIGRNHQEVERGIIPNKNRAEQLANLQSFAKVAGGDRADFWRFRGLRSVKRNVRKSREDLATQPVQTKFPAYERVVLREAGFLRPVVIFGPIADVARERLARELPDQFEIAKSEPRDAGVDHKRHGMIRLYTIKQIIDRDKHALLDVTPNAVDRLNYAQWYPIVLFLGPDSKAGVKAMRQRLCPESNKSARKLYERSIKLRKSNSHLFTATIQLNYMNDGWYGSLKDTIRQQQNQLVWVSEGKADGSADDDLDMQDDRLSYLSAPGSEYSLFSADSRHASDYDDTDTEGGTYTDQEADEAQHVSAGRRQQQQQQPDAAIVRCSEPANPVLAALGHLHRTSSQPKPPLTLPGLQVLSVRMPSPARPPPSPGVDGAPSSRMSRASSSELQDHSPPPPFHPHPPNMSLPNPQAPVAAAAHCTQAAMSRASSSEILGDSSPPPVYHSEPAPGTQMDHNYKPQQPRFDQPPEHIYTIQPSYSYSHQFQKAYSQPSKSHEMQTRRNNSEGHQQSHSYKRQQTENYNVQQPQNYEKQHVNNHHQFNRTPAYETQHAHRQTVDYNSNYHYQSYDLPPNRPYGRDAPGDFESHAAPPRYSSPIGEEEPPYPPRYDAHGFDGKRAARTPDSQSPLDAPARAHSSRNGPTSRSYGAGGAAPAPSAESHGGHGTLATGRPPPFAHCQRAYDGEGGADGPKSKQAKSVMSRIKMFENLDNKARQERLLELQEAQQARPMQIHEMPVGLAIEHFNPYGNNNNFAHSIMYIILIAEKVEIAQNFPDIYAVPNKGKQQDGQEQPQAHSSHFPTRRFATSSRSFVRSSHAFHCLRPQNSGDSEGVRDTGRGVCSPAQTGPHRHNASSPTQSAPLDKRPPLLPLPHHSLTHPNPPTTASPPISSSYYSGSGGDVRVSYWEQQAPTSRQEEAPQTSHQGPYRQTSREDALQSSYASHRTYAFPQAALPNSGNAARAFAPPFAARFPSGGGYTGAARPFQRRFDSPKFSHNLLPEGAVRAGDGAAAAAAAAAAAVVGVSQAPSQHEFDSGTDTFPRHGDYRPKSHLDGLSATPKAIPVSPSALSEEEGHSVVATARGVFDSNGGVLSSVETGVSVVVPRGAIPEGLEQEIYFKVCQDNSIIPALDKEKGETLLSPLVMCGPHGLRFLKPVELRLPHCAAMNPDGWSFALKSSESITGDPRRWHNMALPGDPNYNIGANSVSVLIDHF